MTDKTSADIAPPRPGPLARWGRGHGGNPALGAAAVFSVPARLALLAGLLGLMVLRIAPAWHHGRLLCEEGPIFLAYAWHHPAMAALFRSFAGYLNLGANGAAWLLAMAVRSGLLRLEVAPYLTMALATAFQLLPGVLVLGGRARWLANRWAVIGALLLIAISPMTEEVFANSLHIQFHLALSAGLVLALDPPATRAGRLGCRLLLLLGPLCGPGAIVLLPLFIARAALDRDPERTAQTLALVAGAAVQMLGFYHASPLRGHVPGPDTLANALFMRLFVMPYLSAPMALAIGQGYYALFLEHGAGWWLAAAISAGWFLFLLREGVRGGIGAATWLLLAGMALATASFGFGMLPVHPSRWFSVISMERYNFLPLVLIGMATIAMATREQARFRRLFRVLSVLSVISGALTFFLPLQMTNAGPDWPTEVSRWHANPDYPLKNWPEDWQTDLSGHVLPCPPGALASAPSYCEANWRARVLNDAKNHAWHRHFEGEPRD